MRCDYSRFLVKPQRTIIPTSVETYLALAATNEVKLADLLAQDVDQPGWEWEPITQPRDFPGVKVDPQPHLVVAWLNVIYQEFSKDAEGEDYGMGTEVSDRFTGQQLVERGFDRGPDHLSLIPMVLNLFGSPVPITEFGDVGSGQKGWWIFHQPQDFEAAQQMAVRACNARLMRIAYSGDPSVPE